jgi:hypothetical protein
LRFPLNNYLFYVLTSALKAVHSDPQFGACANVDTMCHGMPVLISPASSMKRSSRTQHAFSAKANQERI